MQLSLLNELEEDTDYSYEKELEEELCEELDEHEMQLHFDFLNKDSLKSVDN